MMGKTDRVNPAPYPSRAQKRALVVGNGLAGMLASRALMDLGIPVSVSGAGSESSSLYCAAPDFDFDAYVESVRDNLKDFEILECTGIPRISRDGSEFVADLGKGRQERFGCVILAPAVSMTPLPEEIPEGMESLAPRTDSNQGAACLYVLDWVLKTDPGVGMTAIKQALQNAEAGGRSFVLMKHAPVAHLFGESLYEHAKRAGVRFLRFRGEHPEIKIDPEENGSEGKFRITIKDIGDGSEELVVRAHRILAAGAPDGSSVPDAARDIVAGDMDEQGFLLSSSVHCHSGRSFTNGVFAVGEAAGGTDLIRVAAQAASAAVRAKAWMIRADAMKDSETVSFTEDCIRCLTCTRICPHAAFAYSTAPARSAVSASAAACRECGVCVAECPRLVLDLVSFPDLGMVSFLEEVKKLGPSSPVVVYGCQRSASRAVGHLTLPNDVLFCSVPCAGRVSEALLWATLEAGAAGILVAGCHPGNCASSSGTDWARARAESVLEKLGLPSGIPAPIGYVTVAANEAARFGRTIAEFCESLARENEREALTGK